jgi:SAM-dependent methyltransferase
MTAPEPIDVAVVLMSEDEALAAVDRWHQLEDERFRLAYDMHERGAWKVLGYDSFKTFVETELGVSRRNGYRMVDVGAVTAAIEAACAARVTPVSQRDAEDLKPHLGLVGDRVREATEDTPEEGKADAARAAVDEVLAEIRDAGDDQADDLEERREWKPEPTPKAEPPRKRDVGGGLHHPAPYSDALLLLFCDLLAEHAEAGDVILDPFAGTGRIHELRPTFETVGVELEPEWAALSPHTFVGDATDLTFADDEFDAIVTSPTYGNRLADAHDATDPERRRSYTHDLGRQLTGGNSGAMQWGEEYRVLHDAAWCEARRVLRPGGLFLLNIKDHIRNGQRQRVSGWHVTKLVGELGFEYVEQHEVTTSGLMAGANHDRRAGGEMVYVLRPAVV